jgi:hypothetical protein
MALAAALVGLAASTLSAAPAAKAGAGKFEVTKWVADGSDAVVVLNVRTLLDAPMVKKGGLPALKDALKNDENASAALKATGIDPFRDIDAIVISGSGKDAKDVKGYVVVRGTFDPEKVRAAAENFAKKHSDKLKVSKAGGLTLYDVTVKDGTMVGAFADKNTFVLTNTKEATEALVKNGGKKSAKLNNVLAGAVAKFSPKEGLSMALLATEEMKKKLEKVPQAAEVAPKLESITASLVVANDANFILTVNTSDAAAAKKATQLLKQAKSLVELFALNNEDLPPVAGDLLAAIKIATERNSVNVTLRVTQELLDKAGKKDKE